MSEPNLSLDYSELASDPVYQEEPAAGTDRPRRLVDNIFRLSEQNEKRTNRVKQGK